MAKVEPATPQKAVFLLIPNDGSPTFIAHERGSELFAPRQTPRGDTRAEVIATNNPGK